MSIVYANESSFRREVLESEKPVLLDFFAEWCGPCRRVGPILEEIARENPEVKVVKVDIDANPTLAAEYQVYSIPTMLVVRQGKVENQLVGAAPKHQILGLL